MLKNVYVFVLPVLEVVILEVLLEPRLTQADSGACLLYTSDAADE